MHPISLSAEQIFSIAGFGVTNSLLTTWVMMAVLIFVAYIAGKNIKEVPSGLQNVAEVVIDGMFGALESVMGTIERTKKVFPLIATFFFFIMFSNWTGLIPGVGAIGFTEGEEGFIPLFRAGSSDLSFTIALALISVIYTQFFGIASQGFSYFKKFIDLRSPINFFIGFLEIISEISRIVSLAFRLFGNVFAGEVLLAVMTFLVAYIIPAPFYGLEIFVGFIQALVFSALTAVFLRGATEHH